MSTQVVLSATSWRDNSEMVVDIAKLGYLHRNWRTLDPTWGLGNWWRLWRPKTLVKHDLHTLDGVDFRDLPHRSQSFRAVVLDAPYKLNGTPDPSVDERYGTHTRASWQSRMALITDGMTECHRVLKPYGYLLVKCQDQVCGGRVRWQTDHFTGHALSMGMRKVDRLDRLYTPRAQPELRQGKPVPQEHSRRNYSTLLVFMRLK